MARSLNASLRGRVLADGLAGGAAQSLSDPEDDEGLEGADGEEDVSRYSQDEYYFFQDGQLSSPLFTPPKGSPQLLRQSTPQAKPGYKLMTFSDLTSIGDSPLGRSFSRLRVESPGQPMSRSFCFGSPQFSSPLDKIRGAESETALNNSLDMNTTFPAASKPQKKPPRGWANLSGYGLESMSYRAAPPQPRQHHNNPRIRRRDSSGSQPPSGLGSSFLFNSFLADPGAEAGALSRLRNPNKALVTISHSGAVLMANKQACSLFGHQPSEMVGRSLKDLLHRSSGRQTVLDTLVSDTGETKPVSGRVVEAVHADGSTFPISTFMTVVKGGKERRYLVVMEKVVRTTAHLAFDADRSILACDAAFASVYGFHAPQATPVSDLLPSLDPSLEGVEQHITCMHTAGGVLPTCCTVVPADQYDPATAAFEVPESAAWVCQMRVYGNLSGLVTFGMDGLVQACNDNFVLTLLGVHEADVLGKSVLELLPDLRKAMGASVLGSGSPVKTSVQPAFTEGTFRSNARHRDGSLFSVSIQVKQIVLEDGGMVCCAWISREALSVTLHQLEGRVSDASRGQRLSRGEFADVYTVADGIVGKGTFGFVQHATDVATHKVVVVKYIEKAKVLSECWEADTGGLVTASKNGPHAGEVPREVQLVLSLDHPGVVKGLAVFQNNDFFQLVMECHGPGFDLFEFIDENPEIDEAISVLILRQVAAGLQYLHGKGIVHRDVKDENVILDLEFHAKLIDFGSAAYMEPGKLFDTFCGTLEYCAPEVLEGNKYPGPEIEVYALGVTLYTLVYAENPFFDVDETIAGILNPPFDVAPALQSLLMWMLESNPARRATLDDVLSHTWTTQDISARLDAILTDADWVRAKDAALADFGCSLDPPPNLDGAAAPDSDSDDLEHGAIYDRLASE